LKNSSVEKILVTGGAGFIGSHTVDALIRNGAEAVIIDNLATGRKKNLNPKAKFYKIDIQSPKISQIFEKEKPEIVFHYAAQIDAENSLKNPIGDADINILGSLSILNNSLEHKAQKIIFASSGGAIYGSADLLPTPDDYQPKPDLPYGVAKLAIENYLHLYKRKFGLSYVSLRYSNVYGPRQTSQEEGGVVAIFIDKILKGNSPAIYGDGKQTRDFLYVEDAVNAAILALKPRNVTGFSHYNVSTGKETSFNELLELISQKIGRTLKSIYGPKRKYETRRSCLDNSKIKKDLGWQPKYNLEEGLKKTIEWFKAYGD